VLCVSFFLISVTKLCDMIIRLCMCNGRKHNVEVLESKSRGNRAQTFDFYLQVTVMRQSKSYINDELYEQHLSEWCHTHHRNSGQCSCQICLNDHRHAAFIHVSNCMTLHSDLAHMVEIVEIAYVASWKSRRRSWIRIGEEVELYLPNICEMIYMPYIAGRKRGTVIWPRHLSLR